MWCTWVTINRHSCSWQIPALVSPKELFAPTNLNTATHVNLPILRSCNSGETNQKKAPNTKKPPSICRITEPDQSPRVSHSAERLCTGARSTSQPHHAAACQLWARTQQGQSALHLLASAHLLWDDYKKLAFCCEGFSAGSGRQNSNTKKPSNKGGWKKPTQRHQLSHSVFTKSTAHICHRFWARHWQRSTGEGHLCLAAGSSHLQAPHHTQCARKNGRCEKENPA